MAPRASHARRRTAHPRRVVSRSDRTHAGVVYRSGFEAGIARDLDDRGLLGTRVQYEGETLWYTTPHFTRVDWTIETTSGRRIYVESKGYFPSEDRTKVLRVAEANPDVDYRLLFQKRNAEYEAWARKHGIKHAVGVIPAAWFNE